MYSFAKPEINLRIMLLFIMLLFLFSTTAKAAPTNQLIFIAVNDELVEFTDVRPIVSDGITYVPLRSIATLLKANLMYDASGNTVVISRDEQFMKIYIDEQTYVIESTDHPETIAKSPLSIKNVNDRIMLPLRFIAEYFQLNIDFYEAGPIARLINKDGSVQYSGEQLYIKYKEHIEKETQLAKLAHEEQNEKVQELNKIAYITFDDGPNNNTSKILNILQRYDVNATFFMVEPKIRTYKEQVNQIVENGNAVALHSVTHDKSKVYKSPKTLLDEMNTTRETLHTITGIDSRLIRVPYGSKPYLTKEFRDTLANSNLQVWDWNVDSNDWRYSTEKIISTVKTQVKNLQQKNGIPVILFHNGTNTVESLPEIIEFLQAEGFDLKAYDKEHHFMMNFWNDDRL